MKFRTFAATMAAACITATGVLAGTVGVFGDRPFGGSSISGLYNAGVMPKAHTATDLADLSAGTVSGLDLLWMTQPNNPYSAGQLAVLNGYINGGGRIAFLGEHGTLAPVQNDNINAALAALGSTMSIINVILDSGFQDATRDDGQIQNDPLTAGVDTYNYAAYAPMNVGSGVNLMFGADLTTSMMAFENVRQGSIFMITDQNVFDNALFTGSNDNAILFDNLVSGDTQNPNNPSVIPLPASLLLLLGGLGAFGFVRKRRDA